MKKKITTIPATKHKYTATSIASTKKRRVAGYARVSTDSDEQFTSYEAQVDYYTNLIQSRVDWEFVDVYTDEGITGTNTKYREGFKSMVGDALGGKIDLIVTKSVSRFARNTVDSLTTVRKLKDKGVEIYFEKENIWTLDSKGELLITIMSSLAQEEARSISENCTWGQRKRFADGKVTVPFGRFLGYDRGEDGNLIINTQEAKTIRKIYRYFLEGKSPFKIAKDLTTEGALTPEKKKTWSAGTVKSILKNEKYKGDALLQKTFTTNFLTKEKKPNEGEIPQYYVEKNHEAIIDPLVWDVVQHELGKTRKSRGHIFSSKILCKECGSYYGSKTWHSTSKYKRVIWQCNGKYKVGNTKCSTPHFTEDEIKESFIQAINELIGNKDYIIEDIEVVQKELFDTSALEEQVEKHREEMETLTSMMESLIEENARKAQDQKEYAMRYEEILKRFEQEKEKYERIECEINDKESRKKKTALFIRELKQMENPIDEFDPIIWNLMLDYAEVDADGKVAFVFRNGIRKS